MVSKLSSDEVLSFLIIVSIILIVARVLGEILRKFKQPAVIGEILAGILLGPSLLGTVAPDVFHHLFTSQNGVPYKAFDGLAQIGIILLMFIAGFEVDLKQIRLQGKKAASISLMGFIFPFALGFLTVWMFYDRIFSDTTHTNLIIPAMFFGTALSITALSVIAKILIDLNILRSKIGSLVLTAAMIDDFLGWILFSIIIQMMGKTGESSFTSVAIVLCFTVFILTIGRWIVDKILMVADKFLSTGGLITVSVSLCLLSAVLTEYLGVRGIFGAFLMGVAIGDSKYFPERLQNILHQFVVNIIAPLFFASIGLRVNFVTNFNFEVVAIILFIACFAKIIGAVIGSRLSGMTKNESYAVAFGMNARGSQEIVLGTLALQAKIIDEPIFVGLVVMTVVTILIAGPLMKYYLHRQERLDDKAVADIHPRNIAIVGWTEKTIGGV
ncbi:cation:proton antiporter [Parafilimonas sp.]|uniref:cation:proton antiporter n=1 Tax=Parafilimonas sp. TaxID=1969739 RepID=UPI0039E5DB3F